MLCLKTFNCADFTNLFRRTRRFRVFRVIRSFENLTQERSVQSVKSDVLYSRCSLQFDIEQFNMRPRRTIQNSTFTIQTSYCRPGRSSDLLPRLFVVVGIVLLAILADRKQLKKNTRL